MVTPARSGYRSNFPPEEISIRVRVKFPPAVRARSALLHYKIAYIIPNELPTRYAPEFGILGQK